MKNKNETKVAAWETFFSVKKSWKNNPCIASNQTTKTLNDSIC